MQLHAPQHIKTVTAEKFQIKGLEGNFDCILDALDVAKKLGAGSEVVRLSDGRTVATVPGHIPAVPRF